jgi:hypothetical protein
MGTNCIKCPICNEFFCENHLPKHVNGFGWNENTLQVYIYGFTVPIPPQYQDLFWDWYNEGMGYIEGMNIKQ